ncbi:MAG: tyrosine-type recombinase/integrase [Verrucomicrobia bacterium]|jgi:integrase|nr:tyrosine-type recombinase/integrase [Verrucomicrobiota bacterium]
MAKRFSSILASELEAFLRFKHNLGKAYGGQSYIVQSFDRYVVKHHPGRGPLDWPTLITGWLSDSPARKSGTVINLLATLRQFCLFRRRYEPDGFVPDRQWSPQRTNARFLPEVLSKSQVAQLIDRTDHLRDLPLRRSGLRVLICTLYSTGMRLGEAVHLRWADVDWKADCFFVRVSKGRSRWVPFRKDLRQELDQYVAERRHYVAAHPDSFLLCRADGSPYAVLSASCAIRRLMRQAGFKPLRGRLGPRPHDLRHGFARERLCLWYRSGVDLQRRLPDLSVFLGHQNLLGTEIYLSATPELLRAASRRMANRFQTPPR